MRACPQCQRTYPDDTDFCPRHGAARSAVTPTLRSAHAGLKPSATSVAAVSDRRVGVVALTWRSAYADLKVGATSTTGRSEIAKSS